MMPMCNDIVSMFNDHMSMSNDNMSMCNEDKSCHCVMTICHLSLCNDNVSQYNEVAPMCPDTYIYMFSVGRVEFKLAK